jgi:hypothetical protein
MEAELWIGLVAGIVLGFILTTLIFVVRRKVKLARYERNRPKYYENGDSIQSWERACHQSTEWSQERRKAKEVS